MYKLIDSGDFTKLEQVGNLVFNRPSPYAVWDRSANFQSKWQNADIFFERKTDKEGIWKSKNNSELRPFVIELDGLKFEIKYTSFGHLGVFSEQIDEWQWIGEQIQNRKGSADKIKILNLFAYTGGSTFAAIKAGADEVVHLDSSKTSIEWAKYNSELNNFQNKTIRYILDDASKFVEREIKRQSLYDGIILDPPTYGRGIKNETFKIETDLLPLIKSCSTILKPRGFISLTAHTPGFTSHTLTNMLKSVFDKGEISSYEMVIKSESGQILPSGFSARILL